MPRHARGHLAPITDEGSALLDQLESNAGILSFRMSDDGQRSYPADPEHLATILDRLRLDWREHTRRPSLANRN